MIDEPGTELSLPGFMYDEDVKMVKNCIAYCHEEYMGKLWNINLFS